MSEQRIIYATMKHPFSFHNKEVKGEIRQGTIKGYSGSVYGFHLRYREKTDIWWQTFLCWRIYDTDAPDYKDYVEEVIQKVVDKLNTVPI